MANTAETKKGILERGANFFEKVHYGLGAAALAGALILPAELAAGLVVFGAYEILHGAVWNWLKRKAAQRKQRSQGAAAPAH